MFLKSFDYNSYTSKLITKNMFYNHNASKPIAHTRPEMCEESFLTNEIVDNLEVDQSKAWK